MESNILTIQVKRIHRLDNGRSLKAFADINVNDALLIKGVRVIDGKKGIFVTMPREQSTKDKKWYDTVRCLTREVREHIAGEVLKAYQKQEN
ncbi:MAG: septation protein SpoVG family protein [Candidatus Omnitrophica bacterium]|nr:septation protein SpoVG family protein [Candidatus Omnitrophota bacterium]